MENESENWFPDTPEGYFGKLLWYSPHLVSKDSILDLRKRLQKDGVQESEIRKFTAAAIVIRGLSGVLHEHWDLGEKGKLIDRINRFGETALRADIAAEETLFKYLTVWANAEGIKCHFRGEELGVHVVGKEDGEPWTAVVDGLDGSANYLKPGEWSYGTMVAVAKGENPTYEDFEVGAVVSPDTGYLLAIKNKGVYSEAGTGAILHKFTPEEFDSSKILADDYFPEAKKLLGAKPGVWPRTGSTAASIVALATDKWQALVDVTRKGNLEQPTVYRIITEMGGVMVDRSGVSIGNRDFNTWGQEAKLPIITARNLGIVKGIFKELSLP